jgi:hypothetical protein
MTTPYLNERIRKQDVPPADAGPGIIITFGLSFDPYVFWRDKWGEYDYPRKAREFLNQCIHDYFQKLTLPDNLAELRTCLSLQCTVGPYYNAGNISQNEETFLRDLVEAIRQLATDE